MVSKIHGQNLNSIIITPEIFNGLKVKAFFTTRIGGVSPPPYNSLNLSFKVGDSEKNVKENYRILEKITAIPFKALYRLNQIHSDRVVVLRGEKLKERDGDCLITDERGKALSVLVADCLPILISDKKSRVVSAIHAGWRGLKKRIIDRAIETISREFDISPKELLVAIGPSICSNCYEVGKELTVEFLFNLPLEEVFNVRDGKLFFDLRKGAELQLIRSGVPKENIEIIDRCTCCERELFFSYRRDKGATGRLLGAIMLL